MMNDTWQELDADRHEATNDDRLTETLLETANDEDILEQCVQPIRFTPPTGTVHADTARLRGASWAFTTRCVPHDVACSTLSESCQPQAGDLVLARVDTIGHHAKLQLASGRRKQMFVGDEIVVAYGNRYASSQFEALIPDTMTPCHLVAGGGIASWAISWHDRIFKGPTEITPIGLLLDFRGARINLREYALDPIDQPADRLPPTIAVVGTGMDSGKTTSAAYLVKGLIAGGLQVGYAKITGTGAGGDTWLLKDAGASPVFDFTDAGMATTYMASPKEVEAVLTTLVEHIAREGVDAIVLEVADGIYQRETSELLRSPLFAQMVDGILFTARDAMGADSGVQWLRARQTQVLALSGLLSASPLQAKEAVAAMGLPVHTIEDLSDSGIALDLIDRGRRHTEAPCSQLMAAPAGYRQAGMNDSKHHKSSAHRAPFHK